MNLNELLAHYRQVSPERSHHDVEQLIRLFGERHLDRMADQVLRTGQRAPDVMLPLLDGPMSLDALCETGPVVLKFYRGRWCPYCTLELRAYERAASKLDALGARVVAISPQSTEETDRTRIRDHLTIELVNDVDNAIAERFGVAYALDDEEQQLMRNLDVDLSAINASNGRPGNWTLPIPALYVIGPQRRVAFSFVDADYRTRAEPEDAVRAVMSLQASTARCPAAGR